MESAGAAWRPPRCTTARVRWCASPPRSCTSAGHGPARPSSGATDRPSHRARLNAQAAQAKGHNLDLAIVLGGPLVDKVAALTGVPPGTDDFEVLGNFYGHPAKLVKCETIDLLVPTNADIVLECMLMATEGLTHDEGPSGEFTGMYGPLHVLRHRLCRERRGIPAVQLRLAASGMSGDI
ncbi:UbiD family decarboxylase domain-containing protein [Mycolicibacterium hodleri]|uniref:UbiD family decarboxylase domain-containing protein n=1 Tax=Mycolicibacterium hodleri TaxID=49897 RepID=UPI0031845A50